MQYTTLLSFALLLCSFFVIAQGCTCTISGHYFLESSDNCTGTMMCRNFTLSGGECIVQDGGSAWVDCLSQIITIYNSSDCSGIQAIGVVPNQCYNFDTAAMYTWNEDCEGNAVPVENSEECEPVPEPAEDEVCFVSLQLLSHCSESADSECVGNWWVSHNQCKPLPARQSSILVDCINGIGRLFPDSTNCEGTAMPFLEDHCPPVALGSPNLYAKWGETCDGEAREESEEEEDGASSQDGGSESQGDGSSAPSLRFNFLL